MTDQLWQVQDAVWCPNTETREGLAVLGCAIGDGDGALIRLTRDDQARAVWIPDDDVGRTMALGYIADAELALRPGLPYWPDDLTH